MYELLCILWSLLALIMPLLFLISMAVMAIGFIQMMDDPSGVIMFLIGCCLFAAIFYFGSEFDPIEEIKKLDAAQKAVASTIFMLK